MGKQPPDDDDRPEPPAYGPGPWPEEWLVVPAGRLAEGQLPAICALSGAATTSLLRIRAVPVRGSRTAVAEGFLPLHPKVRRTHRRQMWSAILGVGLGTLAMFVGVLSSWELAMGGLTLAGWAAATGFRANRRLAVRTVIPGYVAFLHPHPEFRRAVMEGSEIGLLPAPGAPAAVSRATHVRRAASVVWVVGWALFISIRHGWLV